MSSSIDLAQCTTLSSLPCCLTLHTKHDVLHRLLELLPVTYLRKDPRRLDNGANRLSEDLITLIVRTARNIVFDDPVVVPVEPSVVVCGDIHGQYYDLLNIFSRRPPHQAFLFLEAQRQRYFASLDAKAAVEEEKELKRPRTEDASPLSDSAKPATDASPFFRYLLLGDYVDRGFRSIEVMVTLLALKIVDPRRITLLRGNHEDEQVMVLYGFFDECKRRYSVKLFKVFTDLFRCLPVAAVVGSSMFCVHGGISPELTTVDRIPDARPCNVPKDGIICDLLWADPEKNQLPLFAPSTRNVSFVFSEEALEQFLNANDFDLVVRAHQVMQEGYSFFPSSNNRKLITIFSATNYCDEFTNRGAVLCVDDNMVCSILTLEPPSEEQMRTLRALRDPMLM